MNEYGYRWMQTGPLGVHAFGWTREWGVQSHSGHGLSASMATWPGNFPDEWTSAWVNEWCERMACECMNDCEQIRDCICRCGQVCEWEYKSVSEYWVHNMWLYVWDCGWECITGMWMCVSCVVCVCVCVCVCGVCGGVHVCVRVSAYCECML